MRWEELRGSTQRAQPGVWLDSGQQRAGQGPQDIVPTQGSPQDLLCRRWQPKATDPHTLRTQCTLASGGALGCTLSGPEQGASRAIRGLVVGEPVPSTASERYTWEASQDGICPPKASGRASSSPLPPLETRVYEKDHCPCHIHQAAVLCHQGAAPWVSWSLSSRTRTYEETTQVES